DLSFIRVSDLYALLGNAIDNAIEYTTKQTDEKLRSISLRISKNNDFVGIQISNPLSYEDNNKLSNLDGRDIITTKSDKLNHGFGLKSIEYLSQKYNGNMEYFAYDGVFTLQIIFLLPDITIT
ncbi:MAG: ATP-binding protein, partial [Pseudobutyrivibrio sp.]|nr:ATP-binding protein [Pseudobutyrivibrio sp.]